MDKEGEYPYMKFNWIINSFHIYVYLCKSCVTLYEVDIDRWAVKQSHPGVCAICGGGAYIRYYLKLPIGVYDD